MAILIDGYNLLYASGILPPRHGPGGLERARQALLNALVASLPPDDVPHTTVVFDASESPWGAARVVDFKGLCVRFADREADADSLIEELIRRDSAPRQLTVVSSDHRLHRAARRRKATAIDSDQWFAKLMRQRAARQNSANAAVENQKPDGPFSPGEVDYWLRQFALDELSSGPPPAQP